MVRRWEGRLSAAIFGGVADLTSLLPPQRRYGYVHPVLRRVLERPLPAVAGEAEPITPRRAVPGARGEAGVTCVLASDRLDVGGIGSIIELLATSLGEAGVRPVVVCHADGPRAQRLREAGIEVHSVLDEESAVRALREAAADVIELHSASPTLEKAALASGIPLIPVLHNTEIHYSRAQWQRFEALLARSASSIAVSRTVREFHLRHVDASLADRVLIVPNGAPERPAADAAVTARARARLAETLGIEQDDAVVFLCLARYDAQKNIAGMVASFLDAAATMDQPIRLVVAGDPSDQAELRRADGIRRSSRFADRVHLLGNSDAAALLAATDAFILDSFFEGWPVAATEALGAGLPLILGDVGGAEELIAADPRRSVLIANAAGPAESISDARVSAARRRARRQGNAAEFACAIRSVTDVVLSERRNPPERDATTVFGVERMARAHARIIAQAVGTKNRGAVSD
ncbi:glycosyltransferase [Microbacterium sp. B2969]|uniref:Glycosyltransferase n=1 Tax=Microbacterium alkaliflavum TaxID=3248839 RepID=A0ABW7Q9P4_9MICO